MNTPLNQNSDDEDINSFLLPAHDHSKQYKEKNSAADLIRKKLSTIYENEPSAEDEINTEKKIIPAHSKHQKFMRQLTTSGKSLAEIQTAWHNYYVGLPDKAKHEVWNEFYAANERSTHSQKINEEINKNIASSHEKDVRRLNHEHAPAKKDNMNKVAQTRRRIKKHIQERAVSQSKSPLKSIAFGLAMGIIVLVIFLFSFFNEVIIAPFIQPSRHVGSTPLIIQASTISPTATPEVIIPKINVEIPVDYSQTTDNENVIESALQNGVVHYPSTVVPGQNGNAAFFGHSSNNIFNPGKYKFAFVLLHTLVPGDTFYLTYQGKVFAYQVIERQIVPPTDVSVLTSTYGKTATATLITCDPPGTSINRLAVTGVQISPDPSTNTAATPTVIAQPSSLPNNGPSLWSRLWSWL